MLKKRDKNKPFPPVPWKITYFFFFDITHSRAHFLSSYEMRQELRFHPPSGWGTLKVFDFSLCHAPWLVCLAGPADSRIVSAGFMESSASHPSFWHQLPSRTPIQLVFLNVSIRVLSDVWTSEAALYNYSCLSVFHLRRLHCSYFQWIWMTDVCLICHCHF